MTRFYCSEAFVLTNGSENAVELEIPLWYSRYFLDCDRSKGGEEEKIFENYFMTSSHNPRTNNFIPTILTTPVEKEEKNAECKCMFGYSHDIRKKENNPIGTRTNDFSRTDFPFFTRS